MDKTNKLVKLIQKMIDDTLLRANFNKSYLAEVISESSGFLTIKIIGSEISISNVPNNTGITIVATDKVWCTSLNNQLDKLVATYKA